MGQIYMPVYIAVFIQNLPITNAKNRRQSVSLTKLATTTVTTLSFLTLTALIPLLE